jgi:hypothetical protein
MPDKPCKYGHWALRYFIKNRCVECVKKYKMRYKLKNVDEMTSSIILTVHKDDVQFILETVEITNKLRGLPFKYLVRKNKFDTTIDN